jgi:cyanate permease
MWFVRRRGLVSGMRSVFVSFGFAIAPLAIAFLIARFEWRGALWIMGLAVGLGFAVLALIFLRDNPASCGLEPDGDAQSLEKKTPPEARSQTIDEARRSPVFWIYALSLGMHALFGTAVTFHVVAVFAESGLSSGIAFGYFLPAAIFSTASNLLASLFVDRMRLKPFLLMMLSSLSIGAVGLIQLDQSWGYWVLAAGFGIGGGLWGVVSNLAFIRFFGPLHLGAVSGFNASISVFASAIGPAAFSLAVDHLGSYNAAAQICLGMLLMLMLAAILVRQREVVMLP